MPLRFWRREKERKSVTARENRRLTRREMERLSSILSSSGFTVVNSGSYESLKSDASQLPALRRANQELKQEILRLKPEAESANSLKTEQKRLDALIEALETEGDKKALTIGHLYTLLLNAAAERNELLYRRGNPVVGKKVILSKSDADCMFAAAQLLKAWPDSALEYTIPRGWHYSIPRVRSGEVYILGLTEEVLSDEEEAQLAQWMETLFLAYNTKVIAIGAGLPRAETFHSSESISVSTRDYLLKMGIVASDDMPYLKLANSGEATLGETSDFPEAADIRDAIYFFPQDYNTFGQMTMELARHGRIEDPSLQRDIEFRSGMYRNLQKEGYDLKSLVLKS